MSLAKISASCVATGVRNPRLVGRREERRADRAARQERLRRQRREGRIGDQLAGHALDAQPRELGRQLVVARRGEAGDELLELAVASTRTCTRLPARPSSSFLATGSLRRNAAAARR
jgi:hypothetical protein